jgi:hypothetical protein|tara:strand:- start:503 stop:742 length:240 start_codon:yes stop_codon:yes gene_type:complete
MWRVSGAGQPLFLFIVRRHQTVLIRRGGRLGAVGRVGLGEDVAHVIADGLDADEKFLSDLPVCLAAADEAQDFDCAPRF